jgi:two-component system cell cycle response regulator
MQVLSSTEPAVVLIATGDEWLARSIESVLSPHQMTVTRALAGRQALVSARAKQPDAILIESRLPDMDSLDLCRVLRDDAGIAAYTPIIIVSVAPSRRRERLEALRAGAWEYCDLSPDAEELLLKLKTFVQAKVATDRIRQSSLQDDLTGLYNLQGLMRRLQEASSEALRHHRPLACLAIAPELSRDKAAPTSVTHAERMGRVVAQSCRASDAIARLPSNEFIVVATETGPLGAKRLAERVLDAAEQEDDDVEYAAGKLDLRIGFFAVTDFKAAALRPLDMLARATSALQRYAEGTGSNRITSFDAGEASLS